MKAPSLGCIVLAAGSSKRFGTSNKLHAEWMNGNSLIQSVLHNARKFPFSPRIAVVSESDTKTIELANSFGFEVSTLGEESQLLSDSLRIGLAGMIETGPDGFAIFLGDMPAIKQETIGHIIDSYQRHSGAKVVRPSFQGKPGHPVVFPITFAENLLAQAGDQGAASWLKQNASLVEIVEVDDRGCVLDIDVPEDLKKFDGPE